MNNKYEALILTGRLEVQLKEYENLLKTLKDLQKSIIEDDYVDCVVIFGKFSELVKKTTMDEDVMANTEVLNAVIKDLNLLLNMCIEDLNLSRRAFNVLKGAGINTVRELIEIPESKFVKHKKTDGSQIHKMGDVTVKEVLAKLQTLGLKLKG